MPGTRRPDALGHPLPGYDNQTVHDRVRKLEGQMKDRRRDAWESEQWDDNSGLVFSDYQQFSSAGAGQALVAGASYSLNLTVPAQVVTQQQRAGTRFEIDAEARVNTANDGFTHTMNALLYIDVNGVSLPEFGQILLPFGTRQGGTLRHYGVTDAAGGLYTVTARVLNAGAAEVDLYYIAVKCRRGRPVGL